MAQTLLGRIAVHNKLITMEQLSRATREQASRPAGTALGQVLLELGYIDERQLAALVKAQRASIARSQAKRAALTLSPDLERSDPPTAVADAPAPRRRDPRADPDGPPMASLDTPAPRRPVATPPEPGKPAEAPTVPPAAPPPAPKPVVAPAAPAAPAAKPAETPTPAQSAAPAPASGALGDPAPTPQPDEADRTRFDALLSDLVSRGASDIHLHAGAAIQLRTSGALQGAGGDPPDDRMVLSALDDSQRAEFASRGEVDFCYALPGVGRFRANVYRQQRGIDGVFRYIPERLPTLESLGLPATFAKFANHHQGMVLCSGPTGCGKSSTLAALIDLINTERREHILTIEDPIEYLHPSKRSLVNQRSVRHHTQSFASALRAALREDPDVIVIGELRDLETISLALSAAETGHLVLATLHTNSAIRTLNRLIGAFPADQQNQIRTMMSESLRAIVSQRLIPRADGQGRVPAIETLVITRAVGNLIRENKTFQIQSIMQTGASQGMGLLDASIRQLFRDGIISQEDAERFCEDPKNLR